MRIQLDISESIKQKKLKIINKDFFQILNAIMYLIVSLIMIGVGVIFPIITYKEILAGEIDTVVFILIVFSPFIIIGLLTIFALLTDNRLFSFTGKNPEFNRKVLSEILERQFKIPVNPSGDDVLRIYKQPTFWKFGIRVIAIFNKDEVLINISRFNYRGLKSPFHPFFDYLKIKKIIKEFNETINPNYLRLM